MRTRLVIGLVVLCGLFVHCRSASKTTHCNNDKDCTDGFLCVAQQCKQVSTCEQIAAQCSDTQYCKTDSRGAFCADKGCLARASCNENQLCVNATCTDMAPLFNHVARCEIRNVIRTMPAQAQTDLLVVLYNAEGQILPIPTDSIGADKFTRTSENGQDVNQIFKLNVKNQLMAQNTTGNVTLTLHINTAQCSALFSNIGTPSNRQIRVTLYDSDTKEQIITPTANDLFLTHLNQQVLSAALKATEIPNVFVFDNITDLESIESLTIAVMEYEPVIIMGIHTLKERDFLIPLKHIQKAQKTVTGLSGNVDFNNYDHLFEQRQKNQLALAFTGSSISFSDIINHGPGTLLGDRGAQTININKILLGVQNTCQVAQNEIPQNNEQTSLPRAFFAAMGAHPDVNKRAPFGANCEGFTARSAKGARVAWSFASKLSISEISPFLPLMDPSARGSMDWLKLIQQALPLLDSLAFSAESVQKSMQLEPESTWLNYIKQKLGLQQHASFAKQTFKPGMPVQYVTQINNPGLSTDPDASLDNNEHILNALIGILGAYSAVHGFVPLGIGMGYDKNNDQILDPLLEQDSRFLSNKIHTRHTQMPLDIAHFNLMHVMINFKLQDLNNDTGIKKAKAMLSIDLNGKMPWNTQNNETITPHFNQEGSAFVQHANTPINVTQDHLEMPMLKLESSAAALLPDLVVSQLQAVNAKTKEKQNVIIYTPKKALATYQNRSFFITLSVNQTLKLFKTLLSDKDTIVTQTHYGLKFSPHAIMQEDNTISHLNAELPWDLDQHLQTLSSLSYYKAPLTVITTH